jgi:hypothetical protein
MAKLENLLVDHFSFIIFAFAASWLALIAYGLLNQ